MALRAKTFSAVRWTAAASLIKILLRIFQISILARLLPKEDFGLMAMALVVIDFASIFSDLGLNSAFMQKKDVTANERSSLFWANIFSSLVFCMLTMVLSPFFSYVVYGESRLLWVIILIAPLFIINALGVQIKTNSEKELNFKRITYIDLVSGVTSLILAIIFAKAGFGVFSLVYSSILGSLTTTLLYWIFLSHSWRPNIHFSFNDIRRFLGFGGSVVGYNIVGQINLSLDIVLGGKLLGALQLGAYSVPRNLILQIQFTINPIITRVGFPLIAQIQDDIVRVKKVYLKTIATTSSITAPLYVGLALFASESARLLLGPGWDKSGELLRIIAIWGAFRSFGNPVGSLLLGMGRADWGFRWNLFMLIVTPLTLVTGVYFLPKFGWFDGTSGMVYALLSLFVFSYIPLWRFLVKPLCGATLWEYAIATLKPFGVSIISILPVFLIFQFYGNRSMSAFGISIIISALNYILLSHYLNREWSDSMKELIKGSFGKNL
ncbi:colanic acid exporter [bacterium]|nr:colanic acid exporter [bacterium]